MADRKEIWPQAEALASIFTSPQMRELFLTLVRSQFGELAVLDEDKLSDRMKEETREGYEKNLPFIVVEEFGTEDDEKKVKLVELRHLIKMMKTLTSKPSLLKVGSSMDLSSIRLLDADVDFDLVDYSEARVRYASKLLHYFQPTLHHLPILDFTPDHSTLNPYHGILVDSALQHHNKDEVYTLLERFHSWLQPGGILLFRLKVTEHGRVYMIDNGVKRYYTSWTIQEIKDLLNWLTGNGFQIMNYSHIFHKDHQDGTPSFYQITVSRV